jgi:uncharacterized protein (TIGR02145 family)
MRTEVKFLIALLLNLALIIAGCKLKDQEGNISEIVKIGEQEWMKNNLNVDHYQNGDPIPEVKDQTEWASLKTGAWCYYNNDPENGKKCGKLYNWYAVHDPRGLAPKGWRIPTKSDFEILLKTIKDNSTLLKAVGEGIESGAGTNSSGFSAILSGGRADNGNFYYLGISNYFWTSMEGSATTANFMGLTQNDTSVGFDGINKVFGFSVRCTKDVVFIPSLSKNIPIEVGPQIFKWARIIKGKVTCLSSFIDANENIYVTGGYTGNTVFGTTELKGHGSDDIFITKFDRDGNCIWAKGYGGNSMEFGTGILVDANGDCYITGVFYGTVEFGKTVLTNIGSGFSLFIIKFDAKGNCLWAKQASGSKSNGSRGLCSDSDGDLYFAGFCDVATTFGTTHLTDYGGYIAKYDPNGNCLWVNKCGDDEVSGLSIDALNNIYIMGHFYKKNNTRRHHSFS